MSKVGKATITHDGHTGNLIYLPALYGFGCSVCGKLSFLTDEWLCVAMQGRESSKTSRDREVLNAEI